MTAPSPLSPWLARRMGLAEVTPEGVRSWQMAELRRTLAWARGASPFHARRLAGLDVESLQGPDDLARLPRMNGADLAAPGLLAVSQNEVERVVSLPTSGTTGGTTGEGGAPKRLSFSEADLARTLDFFAVGMSTFTRPGDVALVLLPGRRQWGVADLLARALPRIGATSLAAPEGWTPADVPGLIRDLGARVLVAAPAQLAAQLERPVNIAGGAVLSSAEPLDPDLRRALEGAWGCEVFDHWGMTETGYGGGVECAAHSGYHVRMADLLLEIVDPATGAPLPPSKTGEPGEILVTTLGPRAMPLIRYRTGDAARLLPGPCPCGCPLPRLGPVPGRLGPDGTITRPRKGRGAA